MAYAGNGRIVLFGGRSDDATPAVLNDTWEFDGTTWTPITTGMTPPRRFNAMMTWAPFSSQPRVVMLGGDAPAAMVFSPELSAIVLYGGIAGGGTVMRDMWTLTTDPVTQDDIWVEIEQIGELPVARQDPRLAAHRPVDSLVLHAGTSASGTRLDDTWLFQYRSLVPDEICDNGSDDDGDRRIDGKDPDCL